MNNNTKTVYTFPIQSNLSLKETLDCGQSFRWKAVEKNGFQGVIDKNVITLWIENNTLYAQGAKNKEQIENYLDLETDYNALKAVYSDYASLRDALEYCPGIRILRQDFFETLISFILSQNNNISRIKGLVDAVCTNFGEQIDECNYSFPTCDTLASLSPNDLSPIKCGFRARYIIDAANKVKQGVVNPQLISSMTLEEAEEHLMQIVGVGKKVADCTLLFGLYRVDAFPVDVWIKRALNIFFPQGFPEKIAPTGGIAQQYLFHYIRTAPQTQHFRDEERELRKKEKDNKKVLCEN